MVEVVLFDLVDDMETRPLLALLKVVMLLVPSVRKLLEVMVLVMVTLLLQPDLREKNPYLLHAGMLPAMPLCRLRL